MSDGIAVDANLMSKFNRSLIAGLQCESRELIELIAQGHGFVIDDGDRIRGEWFATCGGPLFKEWFLKLLYEKVIKIVQGQIEDEHRTKLVSKFGFPRKGADLTYIAVANVTDQRYIVTEDMHFFDPTLKQASQKAKKRARDERNGCVCRYLRNQMGIRVGTVVHARAELCN